jgi:hypothetical protein
LGAEFENVPATIVRVWPRVCVPCIGTGDGGSEVYTCTLFGAVTAVAREGTRLNIRSVEQHEGGHWACRHRLFWVDSCFHEYEKMHECVLERKVASGAGGAVAVDLTALVSAW